MGKKKVLVAMSGGVDSSVAAALLKAEGFEVIGATLNLTGIHSPEGIKFVQEVSQKLEIPHFIFDLSVEFKREVVDFFCKEYLSGRTPSPCIVCNQKIKFGTLLARAREMGAEYFASGHYAQSVYDDTKDRVLLKKGKDTKKDQSYFLFALGQDQLRSVVFPLGGLTKTEVRERAKKIGLKVFDKPESQEICFIPDNNYKNFIKSRFPNLNQKGPIVSTEGKILGEHQGIFTLTVGQRKGLRIGRGMPFYVISLDKATNTVTVGSKEEAFRKELMVSRLNWISLMSLDKSIELNVRVRYKHKESPARITPLSQKSVRVEFLKPQMSITPGQAAVFYDGDTVVGGGWIE
ncbi:MAG TPA: tRNA 2-thiouridine(34) synthase MnmA [Candidatus Atribacteria bacterium]|nr:tRNA 2-thiouridine(34) synthase MnmA [Candidatus Atribacteria bacterium]